MILVELMNQKLVCTFLCISVFLVFNSTFLQIRTGNISLKLTSISNHLDFLDGVLDGQWFIFTFYWAWSLNDSIQSSKRGFSEKKIAAHHENISLSLHIVINCQGLNLPCCNNSQASVDTFGSYALPRVTFPSCFAWNESRYFYRFIYTTMVQVQGWLRVVFCRDLENKMGPNFFHNTIVKYQRK